MVVNRLAICVLAILPLAIKGADSNELFEKSIRPVLAAKCQMCHNDKVSNGGLNFTTGGYRQLVQSGILGTPDKADQSLLMTALTFEGRVKMPPQGKLPPESIAAFKEWLTAGAPWPGAAAGLSTRTKGIGITDADRQFWAFRDIPKNPQPPESAAIKQSAWVRSPIDKFVIAKLEANGMTPAAPANKLALLRRATFDLTGLPPTEQEIRAFLADQSSGAFAKVIDRLLDSPRYGERWGRHWLDVARYADSTGSDEDHRYPHAWRYRDYVVNAFNSDMPYDRFVREQIAGDILAKDPNSGAGYDGIVATGFLAIGKKALAQKDLPLKRYDVVDDQIDVTGKAILGLTVSCARCHDHKFDPILHKDYYSLASIFASTYSYENYTDHDPIQTPLVPQAEYDTFRGKWDAILKLQAASNKILDLDKDASRFRNRTHARMVDYMLAAYDVYAGGRNSADVAKERLGAAPPPPPEDDGADAVDTAAKSKPVSEPQPLDAAMIDKWAAYLKNANAPELAEWHAATTPVKRKEVAANLAVIFKQDSTLYDQDVSWWSNARRSYPKAGKLAGPRPTIRKEASAFFRKVWLEPGGPLYRSYDEQVATLAAEKQVEFRKMRTELTALEKDAPTKEIPMAAAVKEAEPFDQPIFLRGSHHSPGEIVPKQFLRVIAGDEPPAKLESVSGRLDLAKWLTAPDHPLTARVMANRIWQWHFGEGIVRTPDNFGKLGEAPTHPELLDYLARTFIDSGWSIKKMHREIMLSNSYQMSGAMTPAVKENDPENRLLSHFPKRRLSIEELRDALLSIGGDLDVTMGGTLDPSVGTDGETSADRISMSPDKTNRRSLYLPLRRSNLPTLFSLFDFGDATNPEGKRGRSIVPTQALFLMNSPFVQREAGALAGRLLNSKLSDAQKIEKAYMAVLSRMPDAGEIDMSMSYLAGVRNRAGDKFDLSKSWESLCRVLLASNEFVFVY